MIESANIFQRFIAWLPVRGFLTMFCSLKINGIDNIPDNNKPVILASNHIHEFDPLFIVASLPFRSRLLPLTFVSQEKKHYRHMKRGRFYGGTFFRLMGAYPAFQGKSNYSEALPYHVHAINSGKSVSIFPVGKRHSETEAKQARGGVSYLANQCDVDILPIRIAGLEGASLWSILTRKHQLNIDIGEPIKSAGLFKQTPRTKADYEKAAITIMHRIYTL